MLILLTGCNSSTRIIDGDFSDWDGSSSRVSTGKNMLWVDIRVPGQPVNLQQLSTPLTLHITFDDNAIPTAELVFSPEPRGMGVEIAMLHSDGSREVRSPYELGVMFAPTVAANRFELALDLSPLLNSPAKGHVLGLHGAPPVAFKTEAADEHVPPATLPPPGDDEMRIVSWNVRFGNLLKQQALSARILRAIEPDVLLLQELEDDQTPEELCRFLDTTLGIEPSPWQAVASPVGTRLRAMVAARSPRTPPRSPSFTASRNSTTSVRAAFLPVECAAGTILVGSLHLRCCGGIGQEEDLERIAQTKAINAAIDRMRRTDHYDGIVLGGDLNLVGSDLPLQLLTRHRDPTGSASNDDLRAADAMQLDERSTSTWSDSSSAFTPGRLDWILYSGSSLEQVRAFALDTIDLSPIALKQHGLIQGDTAALSDHLPIVLDVTPRRPR